MAKALENPESSTVRSRMPGSEAKETGVLPIRQFEIHLVGNQQQIAAAHHLGEFFQPFARQNRAGGIIRITDERQRGAALRDGAVEGSAVS